MKCINLALGVTSGGVLRTWWLNFGLHKSWRIYTTDGRLLVSQEWMCSKELDMPTYISEFIYREQLLGKPTAVLPICEPETTECWTNQWQRTSSSSSIGTTAHCGLWPVEQHPSIFPCLSPTLSIFSLPALEDLSLLPLSTLSWVFPFVSTLPVLGWRSFWASYPPFSPGDLTSLSFALLSILLYFLPCSSLLVLESISRFHI